MLIFRKAACCGLLVMLGPLVGWAADTPFSGPQTGEKLMPLKVALAYGTSKGTEIDLVQAAAGRPTLLVLVQGANRPAARLTRILLNYAEMRSQDGLYAAAVWLADDRSGAEQYLQQAVSWWGVGVPVGVSLDGVEGPGAYGLNRNVNVTVLVGVKGVVTANFALVQPSEKDAVKILGEVVKRIGGRVPTTAEVLFLSAPTRKLPEAKFQVTSPDVKFRRLICDLLAAPEKKAAEKAAVALEQYVGQDAALRATLTRVAMMLTRGRTRVGSLPATPYLRRWIKPSPTR